jgi:hypothetical protein
MLRVVHFVESPQVDCCNFLKNKKIGNPNNNEGNDQVDNKKTTNNKTMQTQQHGK